ncbi:MAG: hypothetical protein P1V97_33170, partial [Planctomycetota bacterium]|nr:hypothetical protein [Planctomycetota bacterium]
MTRRFLLTLAITIFSSSLAFAQEAPSKSRHSYELSVNTTMKYKAKGKEYLQYAPMTFHYDNEHSGSNITVHFTEIDYILRENGKQALRLNMDKDHCYLEEPGKKQRFEYATASQGIRGLMDAIFRVPLAKITVDKEGKELTRKVSKESDQGKSFDATIHNARWFHPRFSATEKKWVLTRTFDIRNRGTLTGPFTYTKQDKKDAAGNTLVKFIGVLSKEAVDTERGKLKNLQYIIQGTQAYDEKRKIWVSGKTKVLFTYELANSTCEGTMNLELKLKAQ